MDGIGFDAGHTAVARPCSLLAREQRARICSGGPGKVPVGWTTHAGGYGPQPVLLIGAADS